MTPRHEDFVDQSLADDLVELILHLPAKRFKPRLRRPAELLRIGLRYNGTNPVLNQALIALNCLFDLLLMRRLGENGDLNVIKKCSTGDFCWAL